MHRFRDKMELLRTVLPFGGRLLDVGCASGFFLRVAKESGFEVQGVEISAIPLDYARKVMSVDVFHGSLFDARFPEAYFDVVTLWDTFEHLRDPQKMLEEIRRILKSGGVLAVETLNMNTLSSFLLRARWPLYAPPYHLFYFTRKTLKNVVVSAGFRLRSQFPIQTYLPSRHAPRCIRYFRVPLLRSLLGWIMGDVILYVAVKP
jgi:ubiquinone/menaquinone biosynthesis C-methylase UbiE